MPRMTVTLDRAPILRDIVLQPGETEPLFVSVEYSDAGGIGAAASGLMPDLRDRGEYRLNIGRHALASLRGRPSTEAKVVLFDVPPMLVMQIPYLQFGARADYGRVLDDRSTRSYTLTRRYSGVVNTLAKGFIRLEGATL